MDRLWIIWSHNDIKRYFYCTSKKEIHSTGRGHLIHKLIHEILAKSSKSVRKEVKNIFKLATLDFVNLCICALCACYSCKMLVLNVKYFCPKPACSSEFIFGVFCVIALGATISHFLHSCIDFMTISYTEKYHPRFN